VDLSRLTAHKGELIRLKSQLYWQDGQGWDGITDRVVLLLDTAAVGASGMATVLILVDGVTRWVWVTVEDVELL